MNVISLRRCIHRRSVRRRVAHPRARGRGWKAADQSVQAPVRLGAQVPARHRAPGAHQGGAVQVDSIKTRVERAFDFSA